ncbi:MAG TPA: hypothetical protein VJ850_09640 [Candidatus Limnocylindrales bacterium]|nr:hypothetical protein [Candidatus Limnocylindrales bacterium]
MNDEEIEASIRDVQAELRKLGRRAGWDKEGQEISRLQAAIQEERDVQARRAEIERLGGDLSALRGKRGKAGPPLREGLTREKVVDQVALMIRANRGMAPKQTDVATALLYEDARRIRQVQGSGGWAQVLRDARTRLRS